MTAGYLRYPDIHDDLLTFCAADDVWLAPVTGGRAWRITADQVPVRTPRFSPDGSRVGWASSKDGHWEIYTANLDGGNTARLTYFGSPAVSMLGWADNDTVLVASPHRSLDTSVTLAYRVGLDGSVDVLPYGPVAGVTSGPGGLVVSSRAIRLAAEAKRYRGGTASKLWWDAGVDDSHWQRLLPAITASLESPGWVDTRLIFASDHLAEIPGPASEQANLFSTDASALPDATAQQLRQHTFHTVESGYVRDPVTDGSRVVYHARGVIYLLPSLDSEPAPVPIELPALRGRQPYALSTTENLAAIEPDRDATGSVVQWRGKAFYLSHREGPARALAADSGVRIRELAPLGSTGSAVLVSDADGQDRLEMHSMTGEHQPRVFNDLNLGRILHLATDRAGRQLAAISHDGRISMLETETGALTRLGRSPDGEAVDPVFSPDGRYLVWSQPVGESHSQLMCADMRRSETGPQPLTSGRFADFSPAFTVDGKHLAFLSVRTFDPSYDVHVFDLSFAAGTRPYLAPLSAAQQPPFGPSLRGWPLTPESAEPKHPSPDAAGDTDEAPAESPDLDRDGFEARMLPFPVPAGHYHSLQTAKNGMLWVHEKPSQGALGDAQAGAGDDEEADQLERFDFDQRKVEVLLNKVDDYAVSADLSAMVTRHDDDVVVLPSDRAVKEDDDPGRVSVDLGRLRFELDPVAEWHQMFDESIRLMREQYWRPDLDGVDLAAVAEYYRPALDRLGCYDDLVSLLWELGAEMNTSHAYTIAPKPPGDQDRKLGMLGADLARQGTDWVIERILPGESSNPKARSPLRAAGVDARPGDRIVAVDGRPTDPAAGPAANLIGAANKPVELRLRRPADDQSHDSEASNDRRVAVVALESEMPLRYQDWVAGRAAYVHEHSTGRLGYIHIPDMMAPGWAQLHRDLELATRKEGVIVDVRFNHGGHLSQLVVERLARRVIGWDLARHQALPEEYPSQAIRGPVIMVANEYSGSDGDIVNAAAQSMGIGPVVGTRTWGGVVGINGRFDLVDGTAVTQPHAAFWFIDKGWGVENHGVDPDIEVPITPADWHTDADPQLDRAVAEALERLQQHPAATAPQPAPPRVHR
jgi:tricorn protease